MPSQYVNLMPEDQDFGRQRRSRPEQPDPHRPDKAAGFLHRTESLRDSASVVSPIEFTTGTAGIGLAPAFVVGKDLAKGRLVLLMPDYKPVESELSAIYPPGKNPSAKVRSLIDFLAARFGPEPPWDEWDTTERTKKSRARR